MSQLALPQRFPFDFVLPYRIEPMRLKDLAQVVAIEQQAFPAPWPKSAYRYELTQNDLSTYLVLRSYRRMPAEILETRFHSSKDIPTSILGYGGFWLIVGEAHISTLAIHADWRGHSLGEMMLVGLIDTAIILGATELTLEVRVSNKTAQSLYRKYAFVQVGRRSRYYHDNNEDALIMTTPRVNETDFQEQYAQRKDELQKRLIQSQ